MRHTRSKTWSEIMAQPAIWREWGQALSRERGALAEWIKDQAFDEIWLSGAGSSAFIGDLLAAGLRLKQGGSVRSVASTDLVADPRMLTSSRPLIVSFGRSGNSAETIGVLDALDALAPDAPRLNITCNAESALASRTGANGRAIVLPDATHDAGFAMTSSFTTMVLTALCLLDLDASDPAGRFATLADRAEGLLPRIIAHSEAAPVPRRIVFTGSGPLQFAARESALKVMELSGGDVAALWDSSLGFRHGPKSFVQDETDLVQFLSADPYTARYDRDLAAELGEQFPSARRLTIGQGGDIDTGPDEDVWSAVLFVLFAQIQGTVWASKLGYDADDPFKGRGTLTRVVSGVTLYDPGFA